METKIYSFDELQTLVIDTATEFMKFSRQTNGWNCVDYCEGDCRVEAYFSGVGLHRVFRVLLDPRRYNAPSIEVQFFYVPTIQFRGCETSSILNLIDISLKIITIEKGRII